MEKWKTNAAVLCIFFARPKQFAVCFETVRKAKPKTLLLWQDGPREDHPDDMENILKCREIAKNIDWECEVHTNYHDKNIGCDPSTFLAHKWAFSIAEKCIILEDDVVPSQSFFRFCDELLDKYENDTRIDRICGTNLLGEYDIPNDYCFSDIGNSVGWASWRRVADLWEGDYAFLEDAYAMECMRGVRNNKKLQQQWEARCKVRRDSGVTYWEYTIGAATLLNNGLVIFPRKNLVANVGLDVNSTHAPEDMSLLPKRTKDFFELKAYDIQFPLKHPKYFIVDNRFKKLTYEKVHGRKIDRPAIWLERVILKVRKILRKKGHKHA